MKRILIFILCSISVLLTSCVTVPNRTSENFEYYELINGIPLIIYKNDSSKIVSLQISVKGGSALYSPEYSGLEGAIFNMMTMGSDSFTYEKIQQVRYETQGSLYSSANQLGSSLALSTIDYYFDDLLPILVDGFLNPTFNEQEYTTLMTSISQDLQYQMEDPNSLLSEKIRKSRYTNHPYATSSRVTVDSVKNITVESMKQELSNVHNANRISIIAVGNFKGEDLVKELNNSLGLIHKKDVAFIDIPPTSTGGEKQVSELASAQGSGYIAYTVPAPLPGTTDEIAYRIAADMYSENLFNLVREHYGATYSIGASYAYSKAPFGSVRIFKASDLENMEKYILETESLLTNDMIISGKDADGHFLYNSIAQRLEGFKNTLINSQYLSSQTNSAISSQIVGSLLMFNNAEKHLDFTNRVQSVTPDDIIRVFNVYWVNGEKQWFAITGIGEEKRFVVSEY